MTGPRSEAQEVIAYAGEAAAGPSMSRKIVEVHDDGGMSRTVLLQPEAAIGGFWGSNLGLVAQMSAAEAMPPSMTHDLRPLASPHPSCPFRLKDENNAAR